MAGDTYITVVGRLTGDPELRFTPSGAPVVNFTVASNPRFYDRQSGEWRDGETMFLGCSVWNKYAENVAESLSKGTHVIVYGRLTARRYEDKSGQPRTAYEINVEEVGPALRFASAQVTRTTGGGAGQMSSQGQDYQSNAGSGFSSGGEYRAPVNDPWETPQSDDPPF